MSYCRRYCEHHTVPSVPVVPPTFTVLANQSRLPSLSQISSPRCYYADTPTADGSWQVRWAALLLVRSFPFLERQSLDPLPAINHQ
jgi:hypothetical protein